MYANEMLPIRTASEELYRLGYHPLTAVNDPAYGDTNAGTEKTVCPLGVFAVRVERTACALRGKKPEH